VTGMLSNQAWAFPGAAGSPFEVSFVDAYGADRCKRPAEWRDVRFEDAQPPTAPSAGMRPILASVHDRAEGTRSPWTWASHSATAVTCVGSASVFAA
jgi:hypothetical protein